jgi:hypothetical protein
MDEHKKILTEVAEGKIDVEEANMKLAALEAANAAKDLPVETGEVMQPPRRDLPASNWKKWWQIPFWISMGFVALTGYWMYASYLDSGMSWGFWFALFFFLLSLMGVVASVLSRNSRWLHVRIRDEEGGKPRNIAFSFPIPFRFASQRIRMFSWALPEDIREAHLDEIIVAVEDSISTDEPIEVYVDEEDGNHVEVFIG